MISFKPSPSSDDGRAFEQQCAALADQMATLYQSALTVPSTSGGRNDALEKMMDHLFEAIALAHELSKQGGGEAVQGVLGVEGRGVPNVQ